MDGGWLKEMAESSRWWKRNRFYQWNRGITWSMGILHDIDEIWSCDFNFGMTRLRLNYWSIWCEGISRHHFEAMMWLESWTCIRTILKAYVNEAWKVIGIDILSFSMITYVLLEFEYVWASSVDKSYEAETKEHSCIPPKLLLFSNSWFPIETTVLWYDALSKWRKVGWDAT